MNFSLDRALRRIRPQRNGAAAKAGGPALRFLTEPAQAGPQLLLDSCVYIDVLQGKAAPALSELLEIRIVNHSAVCLAELTHLFGRLDPADARTKPVLGKISRVLATIPPHRLTTPTPQMLGEAGMLAGLAKRVRGGGRYAEGAALLNDATIFLQALDQGQTLLTRNERDFSLLLDLVPSGRLLFYRTCENG